MSQARRAFLIILNIICLLCSCVGADLREMGLIFCLAVDLLGSFQYNPKHLY